MKIIEINNTKKIAKIMCIIELLLFLLPSNYIVNAECNISGQVSHSLVDNSPDLNSCSLNFTQSGDIYDYEDSFGKHKVKVVSSLDEAAEYLRSQMVLRKEDAYIKYSGVMYNGIIQDVYNKALSYDDKFTSDEGDYLKSESFSYSYVDPVKYKSDLLKYLDMSYHSSLEQSEAVNKEVKNVLDNLNVYNKDDYTKIKAVHDYIVTNIKYNHNSNDKKKYSAYDAIIKKSVVCQGFASLTYKMLKDLHVGVRIIGGYAYSGNDTVRHAWNIVLLNGRWYNMDNTWDENLYEGYPGPEKSVDYSYYLKNNNEFPNHYRDKKFESDDFNSKYTMAEESFSQIEDVNYDMVIDLLDLTKVAENYNHTSFGEGWNERCDVNKDGIVDIYDLVQVSSKISA